MTKQEAIKICLVDEQPIYWPEVGKLRVRSGKVNFKGFDTPPIYATAVTNDRNYPDTVAVDYTDMFATEQEARNELADRIDALIVMREKRLAKLRKKAQEFRQSTAPTAKGE